MPEHDNAINSMGTHYLVECVSSIMQMLSLLKNVAWNAMLAIIPILAAYGVRLLLDKERPRAPQYLLGGLLTLVWFVFLPNTCYLLTEWRHLLLVLDAGDLYLKASHDSVVFVKLVLGTLFYFLYALFGMMTFAMAIRPVERLAIRRGIAIKFWAVPFFATVSLGVYLGLVQRFNSWDITLSAGRTRIWAAVVEVGGRPLLAMMIVAFGIFLWAAYESLDIWLDGLKQRLIRGKVEA